MKRILMVAAIVLLSASCSKVVVTNRNGKVPPGQMKKVTGSQSAKPYAPGQQKKAGQSSSQKKKSN